MKGRFGDLVTAMVTPFDDNGALDPGQAEKLAGWLVDEGSEGIVVTGSTGEASTLSDQERSEIWAAVVSAVGGRAAVIAGTGTYDTAHTVDLTRMAQKAGVDAALVVTPYYSRPPQSGLVAHFSAVAASTELPIVLYDIPIRTGRKIEHATIMELATIDNIVGIKDSAGDVQAAARIVAEAPGGFQLYSGNDGEGLPWLSIGAVGIISVASHIAGPQMAEMISSFKTGDCDAARRIHLDLIPIFEVLAITSNPIPVKAALNLKGPSAGAPRLPLVPATGEQINTVKKAMQLGRLL